MIPLELIDEPETPARETMSSEGLDDLAGSLRQVGMLQPLLVERRDSRFRVLAGHRRLLGARLAQLPQVPAVVYAAGQATAEAITLHENVYREDLNPAEEAVWLNTICERDCGGDVDRLCEVVKQKRAYVEERLLLLAGDAEVLQAVRRGEVPMAVARELNKYGDPGLRRSRLQAAIAGGATARIVREWRLKDQMLEAVFQAADAERPAAAPAPSSDPQSVMVCCLCHTSEDPHDMELSYAHRSCQRVLQRAPVGRPE